VIPPFLTPTYLPEEGSVSSLFPPLLPLLLLLLLLPSAAQKAKGEGLAALAESRLEVGGNDNLGLTRLLRNCRRRLLVIRILRLYFRIRIKPDDDYYGGLS